MLTHWALPRPVLHGRGSFLIFRGLLCAAFFSFFVVLPASADAIRLLDGTRYEGEIKREPDGYVVTLTDGKRILIPVDKVAALEAKPKNGDGIPEQRLASLRRAVENVADIKQIIERFKAFNQQYAGTPAGEQAKADMAVWQDRLDRKMLKVGDKWVTEEERKALAEKSFQTAEQAMKLLERGRTNEATPLVDQALSENQQNPAAWYLRGLALWKQDKAPEAHKAFDQVIALAPDNGAAHNDLAVVLWRQNQHVAALLSYDRALLASPLNRQILDNLAEAFNALEPELRDRTTVKKIVRHFNDQELLVQQQLASQGLYRWGSSWVTKTDFDKLKAQEKEIRDRVDRMEADYNAVTARIKQLNDDIASVEKTLRRMEADSYAVDANGRTVRFPLPPSYYTFVRDLGTMKADRDGRVTEQDLMRKQARQLMQSIPTPRYTGVQRMIEWKEPP